jgi:hypothetical protein
MRYTHPALRTGELFLIPASNQGLFACLRTTPDESILAIVNLTGSPIRDYQLSLESSTLAQGEYSPVSLLDGTPPDALPVLDGGRIANYMPVPEIPAYATLLLSVK